MVKKKIKIRVRDSSMLFQSFCLISLILLLSFFSFSIKRFKLFRFLILSFNSFFSFNVGAIHNNNFKSFIFLCNWAIRPLLCFFFFGGSATNTCVFGFPIRRRYSSMVKGLGPVLSMIFLSVDPDCVIARSPCKDAGWRASMFGKR